MRLRILCLMTLVAGGGRVWAANGNALTADQRRQVAQLWDMAEIRQHPLEPEKISTRTVPFLVAGVNDWMNTGDAWVAKKTAKPSVAPSAPTSRDEQLLVEDYYYSSELTPQGANRIYCAIARPAKASGPQPVILVFHGGGGHASGALALAIARRHPGMAALAMDYNGQFASGASRVTQWKNVTHERKFELVPDLRNWAMYHNVTAARRALDFLTTQPWADTNRFGVVGISYGGWVALFLAGVDERVKCVTTAFSAGGMEGTSGRGAQQLRWEPAEQRALWLAAYEPLAYAAQTKAAVFFSLATDDLFFWLSGAERNLAALPGPKGWLLRPNCNHGAGGPELPDMSPAAFMRHVLADGPALPGFQGLEIGKDGISYAWKVTGTNPIARAILNWSPGKPVSPGRYWIEFPATRDGDRWVAKIPGEFRTLASVAFATVINPQLGAVSSMLIHHDGLDPATQPGPQWDGNALWDTLRGAAAWRVPAPTTPATVFEFMPPAGIKLGPAQGGKKFCLLSNSVVLGSGVATQHHGVHLRINGNGHAGVLNVGLLRDTNSMDEQAYLAAVRYTAGSADYELPWSQFKGSATAPNQLWPFDALRLEGARPDGSAVRLEVIEFLH